MWCRNGRLLQVLRDKKTPHLLSAFFRFHCREGDQEGEEEGEDEKEGLCIKRVCKGELIEQLRRAARRRRNLTSKPVCRRKY